MKFPNGTDIRLNMAERKHKNCVMRFSSTMTYQVISHCFFNYQSFPHTHACNTVCDKQIDFLVQVCSVFNGQLNLFILICGFCSRIWLKNTVKVCIMQDLLNKLQDFWLRQIIGNNLQYTVLSVWEFLCKLVLYVTGMGGGHPRFRQSYVSNVDSLYWWWKNAVFLQSAMMIG